MENHQKSSLENNKVEAESSQIMEPPLIRRIDNIGIMERHRHLYDYQEPSNREDEESRPPTQPQVEVAGFAHEPGHSYDDDSQNRHFASATGTEATHDHDAPAYPSSSSFDHRDERSAFTSYSESRPPKRRRTPPPHMSTPRENRGRTHEFENPEHHRSYQTNPTMEHAETSSSYSYPGYPARSSYDYQRYYSSPHHHQHYHGPHQHSFGSPYQPWQPNHQGYHDYPNYHQSHQYRNYYPDYSYSYHGSFEHPHHRQQPHYQYPGSPPTSNPQFPESKETPSAVTDGTTPSTEARRGGGSNLSPYYDSPAHLSHLDQDPNYLEDDRKPAAKPSRRGEARPGRDQSKRLQSILKRSSPSPLPPAHQDFEPIPLGSFATFPTSAIDAPPDPPIEPPPVASSSKKSRSTPQYRYASTASSGSSITSEGSSWNRRYEELKSFKKRFGHCNVPQNYAENTSLGIWVNKQRMEHKNREEGKQSSLNDDRFRRLEEIGFQWAKRKGQASWNEKFNELVAYKAKHGNCHCPTKYKDNSALGRWVSTQRAEYKKFCEGDPKSSMNADKIRRLESIGFAWYMAP